MSGFVGGGILRVEVIYALAVVYDVLADDDSIFFNSI